MKLVFELLLVDNLAFTIDLRVGPMALFSKVPKNFWARKAISSNCDQLTLN